MDTQPPEKVDRRPFGLYPIQIAAFIYSKHLDSEIGTQHSYSDEYISVFSNVHNAF